MENTIDHATGYRTTQVTPAAGQQADIAPRNMP